MSHTVESFTVGSPPDTLTVTIKYDDDSVNPREDYDQLCTIWYTSSRYTLGDEQVGSSQIAELLADPNYFCLRVNAYIHSGVTISLSSSGQYSDPWDGGCCGIIFVSKAKAMEEFDYKRWCKGLEKKVRERMASEIQEFDYYLRGEVYGYVISDSDDDYLESCWGFLGDISYCKEEATSAANHLLTRRIHDAAIARLTAPI